MTMMTFDLHLEDVETVLTALETAYYVNRDAELERKLQAAIGIMVALREAALKEIENALRDIHELDAPKRIEEKRDE